MISLRSQVVSLAKYNIFFNLIDYSNAYGPKSYCENHSGINLPLANTYIYAIRIKK